MEAPPVFEDPSSFKQVLNKPSSKVESFSLARFLEKVESLCRYCFGNICTSVACFFFPDCLDCLCGRYIVYYWNEMGPNYRQKKFRVNGFNS